MKIPGSGIPTKNKSPQNSAFSILSFLARALFSNFVTNLLKCLVFFNLLKKKELQDKEVLQMNDKQVKEITSRDIDFAQCFLTLLRTY